MRAPLSLVVLCACAGTPAMKHSAPACDVLPLLGAAEPLAVAADAAGGLAIVGTMRSTLRAGAAVAQGPGAFVLRTDPEGGVRWLRSLTRARLHAVAITTDGDTVVAGEASDHCLAARFSADGAQRWRSGAGGETSSCRALAASDGVVWIAGEFTGSLAASVVSRGSSDVFLGQLSATGEVRLVRGFGGRGRDVARAMVATAQGEVVLGGQFGGDVDASISDLDFGKGVVRTAGDSDAFLVALGPNGKTRWTATFGDNGDDGISALAVGPDQAIYVAGHRQPSADYRGLVARDVGNATATLLRYSREGRAEWVRTFEGPSSDAIGLAFDSDGRLWAAGRFLSELRLGGFSLANLGHQDVFAVAVEPRTGEPLGGRSWGGADRDSLGGIAAIPGGIAVAGQTAGEMSLCRKAIGSSGEQTGFVLWLRDLTAR